MTNQLSPRIRTGLVIVGALIVALLVWWLISGGDDDPQSDPAPPAAGLIPAQGPIEISADALRELAQKQTIYWAGERPDTRLELEVTDSGNVFVRYLSEDAAVGNNDDDFLTVGTYPADPALELLQNEAMKTDAKTEELEGGGLVMVRKAHPESVYVAYPGSDFQLEVYDPSPDEALAIVTSAALEPVS